tara:strand:+ start:247 stop:1152 length:906 start_codon:yes stop_codon:yes gene_type:complete
MKTINVVVMSFLFLQISNAQRKQRQDADAIKKMCGCYEITFNFAETFNYSNDPLYKPSKTKVSKALEWAGLVTDERGKIQIQHILQAGNPSDPMIIKHWRQDWLFENTDLYMYNADNNWSFVQKTKSEVKGQWTQRVFQVDDSPRYEGSGSWMHVDGKSYWENITPAPLARREFTARNDYNILMRGNRHEITKYGWVHDQDNHKVIREKGKDDVILAKEKGYNTYVKVDDSRCTAAVNWWKENENKWRMIRSKWDEVYERNQDLTLESKVDNKPLYKHLFMDDITTEVQLNNLIESFVKKQ